MLQGSLIFLFGLRLGSFRFVTALFINSERSTDKVGLGSVISLQPLRLRTEALKVLEASYLTPVIKNNWKNN